MANHILLIEDNPADAHLIKLTLKKANLSNPLLHFWNGVKALDYLFGRGEHAGRDLTDLPILILLDLRMPILDGSEVLKEIKSNELTKAIPVTVFSHYADDPEIKKCYALGVNSYIVKPIDLTAFSHAVAQLGLYWALVNQPEVINVQ